MPSQTQARTQAASILPGCTLSRHLFFHTPSPRHVSGIFLSQCPPSHLDIHLIIPGVFHTDFLGLPLSGRYRCSFCLLWVSQSPKCSFPIVLINLPPEAQRGWPWGVSWATVSPGHHSLALCGLPIFLCGITLAPSPSDLARTKMSCLSLSIAFWAVRPEYSLFFFFFNLSNMFWDLWLLWSPTFL